MLVKRRGQATNQLTEATKEIRLAIRVRAETIRGHVGAPKRSEGGSDGTAPGGDKRAGAGVGVSAELARISSP